MRRNRGFCWCVHDKVLLEYCFDFAGRVRFIKLNKPAKEVPIRLYEMCLVKGKLPKEIMKTYAEWGKANAKRVKTDAKWTKINQKYLPELEKWEKVKAEWEKASAKWVETDAKWMKVIQRHQIKLEKLHKKEVPDTCWKGKELDFERGKKMNGKIGKKDR